MSPHPSILALGYSEAAQLVRSAHATNIRALISIHGTHESALDFTTSHRLDLIFDDTDAPDPLDPIAAIQAHIHRRNSADLGLPLTPPTENQRPPDHPLRPIYSRPFRQRHGALVNALSF